MTRLRVLALSILALSSSALATPRVVPQSEAGAKALAFTEILVRPLAMMAPKHVTANPSAAGREVLCVFRDLHKYSEYLASGGAVANKSRFQAPNSRTGFLPQQLRSRLAGTLGPWWEAAKGDTAEQKAVDILDHQRNYPGLQWSPDIKAAILETKNAFDNLERHEGWKALLQLHKAQR